MLRMKFYVHTTLRFFRGIPVAFATGMCYTIAVTGESGAKPERARRREAQITRLCLPFPPQEKGQTIG